MPVLEFHLTEGRYSEMQVAALLTASSKQYAEVLGSPIERVRVFAHMVKPQYAAVGGKLVSNEGASAPYFQFLVLEGRPLEECQRLLGGFTDLIVDILECDRTLVRGACWPVPPHYWAIGGTPASIARAREVNARSASTKGA